MCRSSATTLSGGGGRHAHQLISTRGRHGGGSSKLRLSSASVMEQPSTKRDTATETPSAVGAPPTSRTDDDPKTPNRGRKKKTPEALDSRILDTRASKGGETKADLRSRSSTASTSAPSRTAAAESRKRDPPNLQRYYKTELLTAEEEYTLGMRVRLMVQCEAVHEGLSLALERAPSLEEWAAACGYNEQSSEEEAALYRIDEREERSIRPAGSTSMREDRDPNMFVGNGLAGGAGVGRGNGRAKKAPPIKLGEFWDDSVAKSKKRRKSKRAVRATAGDDVTDTDTNGAVLANKGTVRDFVSMMILGREAKQRMIQCNMRLAVSIAKRYRNVGVNIADLVQEGSIGLARAAEKFDPKRGFKFSTYASWWIQQAVFRSIAYHSRTIRLPVHIHNLLNRVRRIRQTLQQELGRSPTNDEIAEKLGMPAEKYSKIIRLTRKSISLEMPKYQNNPKDVGQESEKLVLDTIDSTAVVSDEHRPERNVDQKLFQSDLREMLKILEEDERRVICARYGLEDGMTRTVTAVAAQFRQPKSWVRSQECRALRKLRRPWYEKRLYEHMVSQGQDLS